MLQGTTDQKIKRVSIWFYVIAALQFLAAYMMWAKSGADAAVPSIAQIAIVLAVVDIAIGLLFVVFGYFAGKKEPWAFVAGLVLYALRTVIEFFTFFSPIALLIRAFLLFRMYQGLQACLDAKQAQLLTQAQNQKRRLEMPHVPAAQPVTASPAWQPIRAQQPAAESQQNFQ